MIDVPEQKEVTVGNDRYIITAFPAMYGLQVMSQMQKSEGDPTKLSAEFIRDVICRSATVNNMALDQKKFDKHFAKKYKEVYELFGEIIAFNFDEGEEGSPNE